MPDEIAALERKRGREFRGVVVAPTGLYFDGTKMDPARLGEALRAARSRGSSMAFIVLAAARASAANDAIRAATVAGWPEVAIDMLDTEGELTKVCSSLAWEGREYERAKDEEMVVLSILVTPEETWVGRSRVQEFEQIPLRGGQQDYDKIEVTLKQHKTSAFFVDRKDAEIAAEPAVLAGMFLPVLARACTVGFTNVATVQPEQLTARVML